jgi:hypothetical protein
VPISNPYIVQYLLDGTSEIPAQIHWCEKDGEQIGYVTVMEDVDVILEPLYSRAGSRLVLRFRHDGEEFSIGEPTGGGWLGRKFSTEDERVLVRLVPWTHRGRDFAMRRPASTIRGESAKDPGAN